MRSRAEVTERIATLIQERSFLLEQFRERDIPADIQEEFRRIATAVGHLQWVLRDNRGRSI